MTPKLERGKGYKDDFIKSQILLYLCEVLEAPGPDIREYLRDAFAVSHRGGVDKHLEALTKEELIIKEPASKSLIITWKINQSPGLFKKIYGKIVDTLPGYNIKKGQYNNIIVIESKLAREIIIPQIIEKIESSNTNSENKEEIYNTIGISPNALEYLASKIYDIPREELAINDSIRNALRQAIKKIESDIKESFIDYCIDRAAPKPKKWEENFKEIFSMSGYRNKLFADLYNEEVSGKSALGCVLVSKAIIRTRNGAMFETGNTFKWGDIEKTDDLEIVRKI